MIEFIMSCYAQDPSLFIDVLLILLSGMVYVLDSLGFSFFKNTSEIFYDNTPAYDYGSYSTYSPSTGYEYSAPQESVSSTRQSSNNRFFAPAPAPTLTFDTAILEKFLCPISQEIMDDPVQLRGYEHNYERANIEAWLSTGNNVRNPMAGEIIIDDTLIPNTELKAEIDAWKAGHVTSTNSF